MKPYLIISFGMLIYAFAATGFLVPHKIVGGGATGIATVLFYLFKIPVGIGYFLVNILLLIIAMKVLGPKFGIKTIFAIIVGSVFLGIMQPLMPVDGILPDEKFMSTIIAAMLTGIGIGVSLSVGGSTGGTDIIAAIVHKYRDISLGRVLLITDLIIISSSYLVLHDWEKVVYGYVVLFVSSFMVDWVVNSSRQSVQFFIISSQYEEIGKRINKDLHRGVTFIDGVGCYTHNNVKMMFVLAKRRESNTIFRLIKEIDPNAFVSQSAVIGVFGEGFDRIKVK